MRSTRLPAAICDDADARPHADAAGRGGQLRPRGRRLAGAAGALSRAAARGRRRGAAAAARRRRRHARGARRQGPGGRPPRRRAARPARARRRLAHAARRLGRRSAAASPSSAARSARSAATWRCWPRARSARWPRRAGAGRGTSSAMPHKRNPVAALVAIAAATRAPHQAATLLAAMPQAHQRGLGDWQAELAAWPSLFMAAHGAVRALADACDRRPRGRRRRACGATSMPICRRSAAAAGEVDAAARRAGAAARRQLEALDLPTRKPAP